MARSKVVPGQLSFGVWLDRLSRRAEAPDPRAVAQSLFAVVLSMLGLGLLVQASYLAATVSPAEFRSSLAGELAVRVGALLSILVGYRVGPAGLRRFLPFLTLGAFGLLLACYIEPFAAPKNGSNRWVELFGFSFQPSELARLVVVLWIADRCVRLKERLTDLRQGLLPILALTAAFFGAVLFETDLGGALLLLLCALSTLWVGGARLAPVVGSLAVVGGGALFLAARFVPYIGDRVKMFFGQVQNEQVQDALHAMSSGGLFGTGIGHGWARNRAVPYLESDYVFAQIGEELGLFGTWLVLLLIVLFLWFALRLVLSVRDRYEALCAFGLSISVGLQAMLHVQVVSGLAPPKGTTLPFISDGGTSLLVSSLAVGLALGATRRAQQEPS